MGGLEDLYGILRNCLKGCWKITNIKLMLKIWRLLCRFIKRFHCLIIISSMRSSLLNFLTNCSRIHSISRTFCQYSLICSLSILLSSSIIVILRSSTASLTSVSILQRIHKFKPYLGDILNILSLLANSNPSTSKTPSSHYDPIP